MFICLLESSRPSFAGGGGGGGERARKKRNPGNEVDTLSVKQPKSLDSSNWSNQK